MDQDVHRPQALRGHRQPVHLNGAIIRTGTESYRLAHTKAQAERAEAG